MPLLQLEQDDNWKASEVVFVVASTTIINALVVKVDRIEQSMMRGSVIKIFLANEEAFYSSTPIQLLAACQTRPRVEAN